MELIALRSKHGGWRGRRAAIFAILGFAVVLLSLALSYHYMFGVRVPGRAADCVLARDVVVRVINVPASIMRRASIVLQMRRLNVSYEFFNVTRVDVSRWSAPLRAVMHEGQAGTAGSLSYFQTIHALGRGLAAVRPAPRWFLVMEDDAMLWPGFVAGVEEACDDFRAHDVVWLDVRAWKSSFQGWGEVVGTVGMLVSPRGLPATRLDTPEFEAYMLRQSGRPQFRVVDRYWAWLCGRGALKCGFRPLVREGNFVSDRYLA